VIEVTHLPRPVSGLASGDGLRKQRLPMPDGTVALVDSLTRLPLRGQHRTGRRGDAPVSRLTCQIDSQAPEALFHDKQASWRTSRRVNRHQQWSGWPFGAVWQDLIHHTGLYRASLLHFSCRPCQRKVSYSGV